MPNWIIVTSIAAAYLILVLGVGLSARSSKAVSSQENYIAGGRNLGYVFLFFIMGAEVFSAAAFLGVPGWSYTKGAPAFYLVAYMSIAGGIWWMFGPHLRKIGAKMGYLTQGDFFSDHFKSRWLAPLIALVSLLALVPYLTIQISGAGLLFQAATDDNVPFWLGGLIAALVTTLYVYTSGLKGIAWTSLVQGITMIAVAWFLGFAVADQLYGGVGPMFQEIQLHKPEFLTIPGGGEGMGWVAYSSAIIVSAMGGLMWPHLFMKFYAANSERSIKKMVSLYPLYAYILVPLIIIGFAGILAFQDAPLTDGDQVLLQIVMRVANFSPWLLGVVLSGALAAAMSTSSNLAHTAAVVAARDLFGAFFPRMTDSQLVRLTQILVVVISSIAYLVTLFNPASLLSLLLGAYGVIVQLMPLMLAIIYWKNATKAGAYAGLISGSVVTLLFTFGPSSPLGANAGIWGLIVNGIALVGVSLITQPDRSMHSVKFSRK